MAAPQITNMILLFIPQWVNISVAAGEVNGSTHLT